MNPSDDEMRGGPVDILIDIACYLTTRHELKKHGGYNVYEDDKIIIRYDTYFPNVSVDIKKDGQFVTVFFRSGHGSNSMYKRGEWEAYIQTLAPKVIAAKATEKSIIETKEQEQHQSAFGPIDDGDVFKKNSERPA